ncbi:hypothetical protein BDA96_06G163600 [Sorghum bicolor]|uniref:Uncharacterized protein n=1 Tax=Sorghum bicolor TaxID=4558 RepID=A0A921UC58_SORBI|nr:hypothetical protein BDA96_06G163600 [Sorghum bicolor]
MRPRGAVAERRRRFVRAREEASWHGRLVLLPSSALAWPSLLPKSFPAYPRKQRRGRGSPSQPIREKHVSSSARRTASPSPPTCSRWCVRAGSWRCSIELVVNLPPPRHFDGVESTSEIPFGRFQARRSVSPRLQRPSTSCHSRSPVLLLHRKASTTTSISMKASESAGTVILPFSFV